MRILFIHEVNYLDKVIYEMHEFPELLALKGHDVTFLHYPESPRRPRRSLRSTRQVIRGRAYPDAKLTLITPPTFGGGPLERYIAPALSFPVLRREISRNKYDVIVLYSVPTTGWQTIALARRAAVPVVFRALDVSHMIRKNLLAALIRRAERYIYKGADLLSANNPAMADYCAEMSGRTGPTVVNLPPIDVSHFAQDAEPALRDELGLRQSNRVLLYMGSFFSFSGLDTVVRDLAETFAANPELRLVLVGGGDLDDELRAIVSNLGLEDRVIFTGVVPYAELPRYLKLADVAINPFIAETLTHVAFPHKVLQYMAAGIPTVSTRLDGLYGVLGEESGVTWASGPSEVAAKAAQLALSAQTGFEQIKAAQRSFIAATFSKEASVASLEQALEQALERVR